MALEEYRRKRRFSKTPEPKGRAQKTKGALQFCVQLHHARRKHYDFRLEMGGVLKSWAVPKGPSYDPKEKRLAVETEDHPLEYGKFEGVIPAGEYGGGPVLLWDRGTWSCQEDPLQSYRKGMIKFTLDGEKLRGRWALIRIKDRSSSEQRSWLLIKERDELAAPQDELDIVAQRQSVVSGRTIDQIAADGEAAGSIDPIIEKIKKDKTFKAARRAKMPASIEPSLAMLTRDPPKGDQWLHEIKFDGYRMICRRDGQDVHFLSRRDHDWTAKLRSLVPAVENLPGKQLILDGEVVVLAPDGTTSFQALQNALSDPTGKDLLYYVFDLLYVDGYDLRELPLQQRKELLSELLAQTKNKAGRVRYSDHIEGEGPQVLKQACQMGVEGIISKRRDRAYRSGRSTEWFKSKCLQTQEFVIGGYTQPSGSRTGFGALLLGYFEDEELIYVGRVGTGFNDKTLHSLHERLKSMEVPDSPFANLTRRQAGRGAHFVKPELVCEVEFTAWTNDRLLRHTAFRGLREDKAPEEVHQETEQAPVTIAEQIERNDAELAAQLQRIRFTHPQRVMYPELGLTKLAVAAYYTAVADWILPHVSHRPLTLVRCPKGLSQRCFYHKHAMSGLPDTVELMPIKENEKEEMYLAIHNLAGLLALVQFSVLEIHTWGSRKDDIEKPDRLVFDLDPDPSVSWPRVVEAAFNLRGVLEELKLKGFLKTTGGKGLHVVVPIRRTMQWPEAKQFCKLVADYLVRQSPQHYTSNPSKSARRGKIYVDYLRNARGATAIAPYSTRARETATVSVPLDWKELRTLRGPAQYTLENVPRRLAQLRNDPWAEIDQVRQSVTKRALKMLSKAHG